jgi:hypothetical protein
MLSLNTVGAVLYKVDIKLVKIIDLKNVEQQFISGPGVITLKK